MSTARGPRCASLETHSAQPPPLRLRPASPTPEERGNEVPATTTGSQPLLACARDSLCLPGAVPYRLRKDGNAPNIPAYPSASTACRRPSLRSDAASTMAATRAKACHRPSIHRGSRLVFYRSPVAAMSSSHRLTAARFRSLPGEPPWKVASANTLAHPIIGPLCKVAEPCNPCRVYSPLRFAYGYITQTIIRRASWWRQLTAGPRYTFASVGFGQVRPWQAWQDAIYNKSPHPCRNRSAARSFRRSAPSLATRR